MKFEKFDNKKIDDIYNALSCRGLYMVECRGEKCPYHTDKYLPIEPCDIVQLREDFKNMINYLKATKIYKDNLFELQEEIRQLHNLSESLNEKKDD